MTYCNYYDAIINRNSPMVINRKKMLERGFIYLLTTIHIEIINYGLFELKK